MLGGRLSAQRDVRLLLEGDMRSHGELRRVLQEFGPGPESFSAIKSNRAFVSANHDRRRLRFYSGSPFRIPGLR